MRGARVQSKTPTPHPLFTNSKPGLTLAGNSFFSVGFAVSLMGCGVHRQALDGTFVEPLPNLIWLILTEGT